MSASSGRLGATVLRDFRYPRLWLGLWVAGLVLTLAICVLPLPKVAMPISMIHIDKLEHLIAYAVLAAWAAMLFSSRRALAWAALGLVAWGLVIEGIQSMLPWRSASTADFIANILGVALGGAIAFTPLTRALQRLDRWLARRT